MIPQYPVSVSSEVKEFYQALHHQLGPDYKISQHLDATSALKGTLLWLEFQLQSLFIFISDESEQDIKIDKHQGSLNKLITNNAEVQKIIQLKKGLLPEKIQTFHPQLTPLIVIYRHAPEAKLNIQLKTLGLSLLGKETLTNTKLKALLHKFIGNPSSKTIQQYIHYSFNPEIHTSCENPASRDTLFSHYLLDKEQENALKIDLHLPKEERNIKNYNLAGVNGGSYSGKSEIIIQRERLLRSLDPSQKILILSPNKASQRDLVNRYTPLMPNNQNTTILSFLEWCQQQLSPPTKLMGMSELSDIIQSNLDQKLLENDIELATFFHEIDFIYGRNIFFESDYLKEKHTISSTQNEQLLSDSQYSSIWKTLVLLKNELNDKQQILHCSLPQLLWDSLDNKAFKMPYDHILIDDAHHLPPIAFSLIKKAIKSETGQLYITQDPNQGIINPCTLWRDTGLDLRGKSTRLLNSYQKNSYILNAANAFYLHRLPDDNDKVIQFVFNNDRAFKKPQLLHFYNERDEENRLLNEIKTLIQNKTKLEDILLITMDDKASAHLAELIRQTLDIPVSLINESTEHKNGISICNLMLAQGQKSEYVFIFGLQELLNDNETTDKQDISYIENTRKLNMAMTCAQTELALFITANKIPKDFISPHIETPTTDSKYNAEVRYLNG